MANLITLSRFPLLLALVLMLYLGNPTIRLLALPVFFVVFLLDTVDGFVARRRSEASLLGSVLDVVTDRVFEQILWVVFSDLGLISVAVPLIVITRGVVVDGVRSVGIGRGERPLGQARSKLGSFLVSSPWMRAGYSLSKGIAFGLLTLTWILQGRPGSAASTVESVHLIAVVVTWIAVGFCLLRGLPILIETPALLSARSAKDARVARGTNERQAGEPAASTDQRD